MSAMVVRALGSSWAGERRCGRRRALRALVATALASSALSPALTQTTAPVAVAPVQPANARTGMDVTAGGTPIVNIAKPDANGTSYNVFNRFSVGKEGLVFDNSPTTGNSATSGFLLANPNLVGGKPASLILNEVTGGVRTTIAGPVEIFGGRAALVIANPTGITCDGCGFINTSRVSLAAATLRFGADGTFSGFRIADGGDVTVEGQGLLAGNVDYFDIIAAATHINASLYAKDVVIAGGAGVFDYAGRAISADNGAARTGVAIDSSVLGGMYANRIRLIGTGAGLGINLRGTVAAIDGPLVITSDGDIALGSTTASGDVSLTAVRGTVTLSDLTYAGGALDITGRSIRQGGGFAGALGHVAWRAEDGVTLDGGKGIYAGLDDQGALIGTGALSIGAGGAIGLGNATLASAGVTRIDGGALSQAAAGRMFATDIALGTTGAQSLTGTLSASGSLTLSGGQVVVGGPTTGLTSATARASDHFTIASGGAFRTNGIATLTAPTLDLAGTVLGGAGLALQATGLNASGAVQSGSDLNVTVAGDAALGGNWTANGDATLTVGGAASVSGAMLATKRFGLQGGTIGIGGSVQAGGTLSLQSRGTLITQDGARLLANGAVDIRTAGAIALAGQVSANDTLTIRTAAGLDAGNATLAATHGLLLNAASLHHGQGGQISGAGVTLTTTAGQVLEGAIRSSGDAVLQGDAIDLSGIAEAESGLTLSGRQVLVSGTATGLGAMSARASESLSIMTGGAVQTNGLATIDAPTLALAGTLLGGSGVSVVANGLTGNGLVRSGGDLSATLAGTGSIGGQWTASGDTRLTVVGDLALSGRLLTGKVLTVGAASVTINGDVEAGTTLSLDAVGNLSSGASAKILANGAIGLISDGAVSLAGQVGTNDSLTIRAAGSLDVGTAAITATGALDLSGLSLTQGQGGRISGAGVTLTTTAGQMLGGAIGATGDASLTGDGIDLSGTVGASGALDLSARRLVVSGTASGLGAVGVTAGESLTIRAGGTVETNGVATLASSAFDHAGTVLGVSGVSLRASGLTGNGAVQSGATLTAVVSGDATLGGSWTSKGDATLSVVGDATFTGALVVAKALTFEAGSLSLGGVVQAEGALSLSTIGNLVLGENAQLLANGAVGVTGGVATLAGRLGSNDALSIRANGLLDAGSAAIAATGLLRLEGLSLAQAVGGDIAGNGVTLVAQNGQKLGGTVRSTGDATLSGDVVDLTGTLSANGNLTIAGRRLVVSGTATGLAAAAGTATEGFAIASGGAFQTNGIATLTAPILDLAGTVLGGAGVALQATSLNASGVVQSGGHLNATVAGDAALGGGWSAAGNATFGVGGTGSVSGTILAAKTFHLQAGTVAIDGSVEAGGIASLTSLGALTTSGGARLLANGAVDIRAAGAIALAGQVGANDTLTIRAAGALEAGNAILTATHALDLNGASLHQGQGGQISGAGMTLTTTAGQVLAGAVRSSGNAVLQADTIDMPGIVEADGALTLSGRVLSVSGMATGLGAVSARASESLSIMPGGAVQTNGLATIGAPSLVLAGTLLGGTSVSVVATDLSGSGLVRSGGDLSATLAGTGSIGGQWTASGDTRLTVISDLALSSGLLTGKALTVRAARVTVDGDVEAGTTLSLDAAGDLSSGMAAKILANGAVDLTSGGAVSLAGQVGTNDALTIRAAGALDLGAATITAGGALGLSGLSLLQGQGGTISATGDASLTGDGIDLSGTVGAGGVLGLSARRLVVSGTATGLGAVGVTAGESLTIRAGGTVETNGVATLSSSAFDHAGTILGVGGVSLQASGLTGNGTVQSGGTLTAIVSGDATLGGSWTSKGDAALSVVGDTTLTGMLAVAKALTFEAGSLSLGGVVQAEGAVSLSTVGNLAMDQNAQLLANGPVGVTSGGVATLVGRLGSNDALSIRASGLLDAGSAAIAATGALRLDGLSFRQMVGGDIAGDGVTLVARNAQKLGGKIRSTSYAAVSGDVVDLTGTLSANGDLTVSGRQVVVGGTATGLISATGMATDSFTIASGGAFQTNGIATLTAPTLDLAGMVLGGAGVSLRATNINVTGGIQSGSDLAMTLAGDARLDGSWVADGNLTLGIGGQAVIGGTMSAAKALTVNAAGLTIGGGLQAGGTLSVESQGDLGTSASSQIQANGAIGLTAAGSVSLAGQVGGNGMVGVTGRAIVVPGTVQAIGNLSLSGETLSLTGKVLTAADGTVAMTGAVGIDGTLSAGGNLTLDAAALSTGSTGQLLTTKAFALIASGAFDHRGTLDAASIQALADSIANDGTMAASADLALSANADIIQAGTVQAGRNLTLEGAALTLSGKSYGAVAGGTGTGLTIRSDAIGFNQTSDIQSGGTLDIVGTQGFATLGRIVAMGRAGIHSDGALTQGAVASGNDRFALTAGTTLDQTGTLAAIGRIDLSGAAIRNSGSVTGNDELALDATSALTSTGILQSSGALRLAAPMLTLSGKAITNDVLYLDGTTMTLLGTASGLKGIDARLGDLSLDSAGVLQSGEGFALTLAQLDNAGLIASDKALSVSTSGGFANSGQIAAETALTVAVGGDGVSSGLLQAGGDLDLRIDGAASLSGTLYAGSNATIGAASLRSSAAITSQGAMSLTVGGDAALAAASTTHAKTGMTLSAGTISALGTLQSDAALAFSVGGGLTLGGRTQASGPTRFDIGGAARVDGTLASGGALTLNATAVSIPGRILANDAVSITASSSDLDLTGTIQAVKDVALNAVAWLRIGEATPASAGGSSGSGSGSSSNSSGTGGGSGSGGGGTSSSGGGSGSGGTVGAIAMTLPSLGSSMTYGSLASNGEVALRAANVQINGTVAAKGALSLLADHLLSVQGGAWSDTTLIAQSSEVTLGLLGSMAAAGAVGVTTQGDLVNRGIVASNAGALTMTVGGAFDHRGTLSASTDLRIHTGLDYVASGTVSGGSVAIEARDITLDGRTVGVGGLSVSGRTLTLGEASDIESKAALTLQSRGATSLAGKLLAEGNLTATADSLLSLASTADIQSGGMLKLEAQGDLLTAASSRIVAIGAARVKGDAVTLGGSLAGNAALDLIAASGLTLTGSATALGEVTASASVTNLSGRLASGAGLGLAGGAMVLGGTSTLQALDGLTLSATVLTGNGTIQAGKNLTIASQGGVGLGGTLSAGRVDDQGRMTSLGDLEVTAGGALDLNAAVSATGRTTLVAQGLALGGTLTGLGNLSLDTATLATTGSAKVGGTMTAAVRGDVTLGGTMTGLTGLAITSGGALVQNAALATNGALTLGATGTLSHGGTSDAVGKLELTGRDLALGGALRGNAAVTLTSNGGGIDLATGGQVTARTLNLMSAGSATVAGMMGATDALSIRTTGALMLGASGTLQAGTSSSEGQVTSVGSLTLTVGGDFTQGGSILSTGVLNATASSVTGNGGFSVMGDMDLAVGSGTIGGNVVGVGQVAIRSTGGALTLNGGVEGRNVTVSATGGDLTLAEGTRLSAYGTGSDGMVRLSSSGAIEALGMIGANGDATLNAGGRVHIGVDPSGAIRAFSTLGKATIDAGGMFFNEGSVATDGLLDITASGMDSANLQAGGGATATIAGGITLRGATAGLNGTDLKFEANGGNFVVLRGATVETKGAIRLSATGALTNSGVIAGGTVGAASPVGSVTLTSGGGLISTGAILSNNGNVSLKGGSVTLGGVLDQGGGVYAAGLLSLDATTLTVQEGGQVVGNTGLTYAGTGLDLGAGSLLQSNQDMTVTLGGVSAPGSYGSAGSLVALGDVSLTVTGGAISNRQGAGIFAGGSGPTARGGAITLRAGTITNAGSIVATASASKVGGGASLTAATIDTSGLLHADGILGVSTDSLTIGGGVETAQGIDWSIPALSITGSGSLKSLGGIILSGATFTHAGRLAAGGDLKITTSGDLTSNGTLSSIGAASLSSATRLTLGATSETRAGEEQAVPAIGTGTISLRAGTVVSLGALSATGSLAITGDSVTIGGSSVANGDVTMASHSGAAPSLTIAAGGTLTSHLGDVRLGTLSAIDLGGSLTASKGSIGFTTGRTAIATGGRLVAGRDVEITTTGGGTLSVEGYLAASNDVILKDGILSIASGGIVEANRDVSFTTSDASSGTRVVSINGTGHDLSGTLVSAMLSGKIGGGRNVSLTMPGALVAQGSSQIVAANDMNLTAGYLLIGSRYIDDVSARGVVAGHNLSIVNDMRLVSGSVRERGLLLDGSVQAVNDLTVQVSGAVSSTTASQFVAGKSLSLTGAGLDLSGFNSGQDAIGMTAQAADGIKLGGKTASDGRVAISGQSVTIAATGSITTHGGGGNPVAIGRDIGDLANIAIKTSGALTNQGSVWSDGVVFLKSSSGDIVNNATGANGGITAKSIVSQTDAGNFLNTAGAFKADDVALFLGGDFNNRGSFTPSGNYRISAANISNTGTIATSGNLTLEAVGALYNVGTIYSGKGLTLTAGGALTNDYSSETQRKGLIFAQGDIDVTAHDVKNQSATIQSLGGSIAIRLTGGDLVNTVKKLVLAESSIGVVNYTSQNGRVKYPASYFIIENYAKIFRGGLAVKIPTSTYPENLQKGRNCLLSSETLSGFQNCVQLNFYNTTLNYEIFEPASKSGDTALSENTGSSYISSANDVSIYAVNGNVVNQNSSILAGGKIAIDTTGSVKNVSDLLVENGVNKVIPSAPTLIQAGGAITIEAGNFSNIAKNLVGTDTFTGSQVVPNQSPTSNSQTTPGTGSTGINASASASNPGTASTGSVSTDGSAASGAGGAPTMTARAQGNASSGRWSGNAYSDADSVTRGGGRFSASVDGAAASGGVQLGATADAGPNGQAIGSAGGGVNGATAMNLGSDTVTGRAADGGSATSVASTVRAAGTSRASLSGAARNRSAFDVEVDSYSNGGNGSPSLQGGGSIAPGTVSGSGSSLSNVSQQGGAASGVTTSAIGSNPAATLSGGASGGPGSVSGLDGLAPHAVSGQGSATFLDGASPDGGAVGNVAWSGSPGGSVSPSGALSGTGFSSVQPGASAILPALVAGFDRAGVPSIGSIGYGTFLGGFLASFNLTGNTPSLFTYSANPNSAYLFSTISALSSEAKLYDSAWFFDRVSPDRATTYTRLGDGFMEAMLVSREVQARTGQAQLSSYGSVLDQYQGLLKSAEVQGSKLGLQLGIALTAEQVAALTEPMVWYVKSNVAGRDVLVPVVYLTAADPKAITGGALIGGSDVAIVSSDGITNSGTIQARNIVALAAQGGDLVNAQGATISGGSVVASAARDIVLAGGSTIQSAAGLVMRAGRDITTETVSSTSQSATASYQDSRHWANSATTTERITGATIAAGGDLSMRAGNDITLNAATLSAGGAAQLAAARNLSLDGTSATTTTTESGRTGKYTGYNVTTTTTRFTGTSLTAAGPISLAAGADLSITGSTIRTTDASDGGISLYGGQGISIVSALETATLSRAERTGKKSNTTTSATSTTNLFSDVEAAGDLTIVSPGAVRIAGASVVGQGALAVDVGSLTLTGVVDTVDSTVGTYSKKSGLFSSTVRRTTTTSHDETAIASTLSGDSAVVTAGGAVTITGANLVAATGLDLSATGPVTIGALATTDSESSQSSVKKSGFSLGGGGLFLGVAKTNVARTVTDLAHAGSVVGTSAGDSSIVSGGALSISGSKVAAANDLFLQGSSVSIANVLDARDTTQTTKSSSIGVSIGVQSPLLQSVGNLVDMAKIATGTGNARVAAVAGLAGGMAAVNTVDAGKDLAQTLSKGSGDLGVTVSATFGMSKSRATDRSHDETVLGSEIRGRDVSIVATGMGGAGTIAVRGSEVAAARDLTLAATGPITLASATETDGRSGSAKSSGFSLGVSADLGLSKGGLGLSGPKATVSLSSSKSSYDGTEVTHVETLLDAGGTARLTTPGALSLEGALVSGDRVRVDAGSLSIASLQDTASYRSKSSSGSLGASVGLAPGGQVSVSGHVSQGRQTGDFASVGEQSGLYAGDGGFAIRVGGDTVLRGAVIASTAEASSNSLVTGTLEAQDIANREQWSADQVSMGGGIGGIGMDRGGAATATGGTALPGVSVAGVGTVTATPPMALSAGGSQSGTTRSAIGAGTIEVTGDAASRSVAATISRDTGAANDGALIRQFTNATRAEVAQGFQAAQVLVTETSAFFASRAREEDRLKAQAEEARQRGNTDEADRYTNQAEKLHEAYGPGSTARLVATAVSGAAGGDATGSLSGLVQASAVNVLQGLATQQVKALADELGGSTAENSAARAALQAVVGCAGQAAGGTGDCSAGAMGAASAVVLNQLLKSGPTPSTDKDGQPLSQSAGQARDALVSTLVAAVASGAGLDAASATVAARIETQNNATVTPLGRYGPDNKPGLPVADVYEHDPAFRAAVKALGGLEAYEAVTKCVRAGPFCPTTPAQQAALTAYSQGSDRLEGQARIDAWLCSGETPLLCGVQAVNAFNQTPLGVRLVGTQQAIGGGLQMVTGGGMAIGGLAICAESLGAGCGLGALGAMNFGMGLDNARSGVGAVWDGTPKGTLGGSVISAIPGVSPDTAEAIYGQANLAVGLVTSGVTIGRGSVPAVTTTQAAVEAALPKGVPSTSEIVLGKSSAVPTVQEILARSAPVAAEGVGTDLALTYKPGWSVAQRTEADLKVQILTEGDTVVSQATRSGTSAASRYRSAGNQIAAGSDIDHAIDLQLGGSDTLSNMWPLNSSVNRSLGAQIQQQIKNLPPGTVINRVTIGER